MVGRLHEKVALVAAAKRQLPQGIVPARSPHSAGCVSRGNSICRGRSSPEDVAIEISTTAASWPWNLSTVPT